MAPTLLIVGSCHNRNLSDEKGGDPMTESREELKGRLLVRWLEDLKSEKEPGLYEEMSLLSPAEVEEVMDLARFAKANFYPGDGLSDDVGSCARVMSKRFAEELARQIEANRAVVRSARSFGELIRTIVKSLSIDRSALRDLIKLPNSVLRDLETGQLAPHRVPLQKMVRLLLILRLTCEDVVELVRKSSLEWTNSVYSCTPTRLGRIGLDVSADERARLLRDPAAASGEQREIEEFCSGLAKALRSL
jgi:hypothetical protein